MTLNRQIADLINAQGDVKQDKTLAINAEQMDSAQAADVTTGKKIAYYDSLNLLPIANLTLGDRAFVGTDSNNARLYISNGSGWYNTGMVNTSPVAIFDSSSYSLDSADDTLLITLGDSDFDQSNLKYSFAFEPSNIVDSAIDFTHDSARSPDITLTVQDGATGVHNFKILGTVNDGNAQHTDSADVTLTLQSITLSSNVSSLNEGNDITYTLACTGLAETLVGYTLSGSGITAADIDSDSLSGFIHINSSNQGSLVVGTVADYTTEGTETIRMSIDAPYDVVSSPSSVNVTINDTSLTPSVSSISRSASSVNEGQTVTFTVNTSNMTSAQRVYYRITGVAAADISSTSSSTGTRTYNASTISSEAGYITVNGSNQATLSITFTEDNLTEGNEVCYFRCTRLAQSNGTTITNNTTAQSVTVNDTSITHPTNTHVFHTTQTGNNQYTDYSWTVPANVNNIRVVGIGGGGGGSGGHQTLYGGGGGGGGSLFAGYITGITPGQTWKARIARGGQGGAPSSGGARAASQTWLGRHVGSQVYNAIGNAGGGYGGIQGASMSAPQNANGGVATRWTSNPKDSGVLTYWQYGGSGGDGGRWMYQYGVFSDANGKAGGGGGAAGFGGRNQTPGAGQSTTQGTYQSSGAGGSFGGAGNAGTSLGGCGGGGSGKGGNRGGSFGNQWSASLGSGAGGSGYNGSQLVYGGEGGNLGGSQQLAGGGGGGGSGRYTTGQTQSGLSGRGGKIIIQYGSQTSQQRW